jgi:hypothetical protein
MSDTTMNKAIMNEAVFNELLIEDSDEQPRAQSRFDFAQLLRWLGCAGVVLSGIVFLIQGFDDIALSVRNWAYLGLMLMLGSVGVGLKYAFEDGKGARLLLALAIAVIPIQFAQLGGMIHSLVGGASDAFPATIMGLMEWGALSWGMVIASGAATLLLAFTVGAFGFRVLARPQATALTLMNTLLCASLLIPVREGLLAVVIFLALGLSTLLTDVKLGRANPVLRTTEGRAARFLLLLPLLIAGARASFYIGDIAGLALITGMLSMAALVGAYHYVQKNGLRELMFALGSVGVCAAWSIWTLAELSLAGAQQMLCLFALEGLFLLGMSKISSQGRFYRLCGSLLFGFAAIQILLTGHGLQTSATALALGVVLGAIGYLQKWRMPAVIGALLVVVSTVPLTAQALVTVEFGTWLGLAIGGVGLVVLASVVERYGRRFTKYAQASWVEVKAWD